MNLQPHRKVPNRARELRERVWAVVAAKLGRGMLCSRCGCTLMNYDEKCDAGIDDPCPGANQIERARQSALHEMGLV